MVTNQSDGFARSTLCRMESGTGLSSVKSSVVTEKLRRIRLFYAAKLPIKRHKKISSKANPYDPEWESYFEKRIEMKMVDALKGKWKLLYLWQEQNGICPICQQKITKQTGWNLHHIVWRVHGGRDTPDNCILLHPNCHRQVHCQGLKVEKLRPLPGVREA